MNEGAEKESKRCLNALRIKEKEKEEIRLFNGNIECTFSYLARIHSLAAKEYKVSSLYTHICYMRICLSVRDRIATYLSLTATLILLSTNTVPVQSEQGKVWCSLKQVRGKQGLWERRRGHGLYTSRRQHQCHAKGRGRDTYIDSIELKGEGAAVTASN